ISMSVLMQQAFGSPARAAQKIRVVIEPADKLYSDGQTVGTLMRRQRERRRVQRGPEFLKARVAREGQPLRRFTGDAGHQQHIRVLEHVGNLVATVLDALKRCDVALVRN